MEPFTALLVSNDAGTLTVTNRILDDYGVRTDVATDMAEARQHLTRSKYDLVVYDQDVPEAVEMAGSEPANHRPSVIFALVKPIKGTSVKDQRVHFIVQKPFTADLFTRSIRAAYSMMVRDKRAAFRHSVLIKAAGATLVHGSEQRKLESVKIVDLSQTGLGLRTTEMLPNGSTVQVTFQLPENNSAIHVTGTVMWSDASHAGLKFTHIPGSDQQTLNQWLNAMLPWDCELSPRNATPPMAGGSRAAQLAS